MLAAIALAESASVTSTAGRERAIVHAIEQATERLGNMPAICRASYVDPRPIERFRAEATIAGALARIGRSDRSKPATLQKIERAVVALLSVAPSSWMKRSGSRGSRVPSAWPERRKALDGE